jgi:3-phenylpropionate/trans-cinnamate dioxygenase ferredoxin subunit
MISDPAAGFVVAALVDELPRDRPCAVQVDGTAVVVVLTDDGCYAVEAECPHAGGPLDAGRLVGSHGLECPLHGAVFDVRNGEVLRGPARRPLRCYAIEATDAIVRIRLTD